MPPNRNHIVIRDAELIFLNFQGKKGKYNKEGEKSFCVKLGPEDAERLSKDGWNVKTLKQREEDEYPQPYMLVRVNYDSGKPPKVVMRSSKRDTYLGEDLVEMVDFADIEKADVVLNPYNYNVNGERGISAYLRTLLVTIYEDELEIEIADRGAAHKNSSIIEEEEGADF